jgi:hypothetical protein
MSRAASSAASSMRARVGLTVVAAVVWGWAGVAGAETKRVGVPHFDGPQEGVVRRAVIQVLKGGGYEVVGARAIDEAAKSTGTQLDSNDGFKAVAKELAISAFVTGEVAKKKAKLTVRNGADGSVSGEGSFAGANPGRVAAEVRDGFSRRLGSAVDRGRAPAGSKEPTVAAAAEPEEAETAAAAGDESAGKTDSSASKTASSDEAPSASADSGGAEAVVAKKADETGEAGDVAAPRALDMSAGFRAFSRSLTYNDDLYGQLRSYKLTLGPAVAADIILYPLAFSSGGLAANFGVEGHVEYAFGVSSNVPPVMGSTSLATGGTLPTEIHDYWGGVRGRVPFGPHEVALSLGGGEHAFSFRGGALRAALADTPDTIYHYARVGVDARFVLATGLVAGLGFGYRYVLNHAGQISDPGFFPFLSVYGVDLDAKIGYQVAPSLEARLSLDLRRYAFAMNSEPADVTTANPPNQVAGGAIDQYLSITASIAYVFGGVSPSARPAPAAEESPPAETPSETPKKKKKKKKADDEDAGGGGSDDSTE